MEIEKLKDAEYVFNVLKKTIPLERIIELAECGYMPHYKIDGAILFYPKEVKEWLSKNMIKKNDGQPFPKSLTIVHTGERPKTTVPESISNLNLYEIPPCDFTPWIYFLCFEGCVVYVGQSITPGQRVGEHVKAGKIFDAVYVLPTPISDLDHVESKFIIQLRPRLNGCYKNGKMAVPIAGLQQ